MMHLRDQNTSDPLTESESLRMEAERFAAEKNLTLCSATNYYRECLEAFLGNDPNRQPRIRALYAAASKNIPQKKPEQIPA